MNVAKAHALKTLGYVVLAMAIGISLVFVHKLQPVSPGAWAFFAGLLAAPYLVLGIGIARTRGDPAAQLANLLLTLVVALAGISLLINIVILHPDAQGAIGVVMTPILQLIGIAILWWPLRWWLRRRSH